MSSPHRVQFVKQLDGSKYAGLNCNCAAAAMALDRHTIGKERTTGARVRQLTGDTTGGTRLQQVHDALKKGWGVDLPVKTPTSLTFLEDEIEDGRGAVVQGRSSATRGTKYQGSETFNGNHSWYLSEGRGWRLVSGHWQATDYLVYDPLADGRRPGIAKSPFWLPRRYLLTVLARLDLDGRGHLLGPGKAYAMFTRDTEPHAHFTHGGRATSPFPDRTRGKVAGGRRVNVRSGPATSYPIVDYLANHELYVAYQRTDTGQSLAGSRRWYGDHDGNRWVHKSGLSHTEGST
jgi:hypothetical protein